MPKRLRLNGTTPKKQGGRDSRDSSPLSSEEASKSDDGPILREKREPPLKVSLRFAREIDMQASYQRSKEKGVPEGFDATLSFHEANVYDMPQGSIASVTSYVNMTGNDFSTGKHNDGSHGNLVSDPTRYKETDHNEVVTLMDPSDNNRKFGYCRAVLFMHWFNVSGFLD